MNVQWSAWWTASPTMDRLSMRRTASSGRCGGGRHPDKGEDRSVLAVNSRCGLVDIPAEAHDCTVSGRSPLQWAIDSLRLKHDKRSGIADDPNGWHAWADEPFSLIRHMRRLVRVSVETAQVVAGLPPSLPPG